MDVYPRTNVSSCHEFLLAELGYSVCLIKYKSLSVLNKALSRQYFPSKMKQCKNYLTFMVPCYIILSN